MSDDFQNITGKDTSVENMVTQRRNQSLLSGSQLLGEYSDVEW